MFTALTLTLALGAPVPAPTDAPPAGTPPRLMELKADANGKITVMVMRTEMQKVPVAVGGAVRPGGNAPPPAVLEREVQVTKQMVVEIGDVKDLTITTADGKKLDKDEAMKRLGKGAIVVVSGDGKPVSPTFLKVFKDETLVLASPELTGPQMPNFPGGLRPLPAPPVPGIPPGGVQILPINPNGGPGGVIQIQVAPAVLPVPPAVPVPPQVEKPVVKPPEK